MNENDEQAFKVACDALYAWGYSEQFSRSLWITALEYARNKQAKPVQPAVADFSDAYQGAREDLAIWKKRALKAEELNRKFIAAAFTDAAIAAAEAAKGGV